MRSYQQTELRYERRAFKARLMHYSVIVLAAIAGIAWLFLWVSPAGRAAELYTLRTFYQLRGPITPPPEIVLVALDDALLDQFGRPLPRRVFADLFDRLAEGAPRGVVIDISFPPDDKDPAANERMAATLRRFPATIGGGLMRSPGRAGSDIKIGTEAVLQSAVRWQLPMRLRDSSGVIKLITLNPAASRDDVISRIPLSRALIDFLNRRPVTPEIVDLINFYGPSGTINRFTAQQILELSESQLRERFTDRLVLVGRQTVPTPPFTDNDGELFQVTYSDAPLYGVEIHATILANLLEGRWIRSLAPVTQATLLYFGTLLTGLSLLKSSRVSQSILLIGILVIGSVCSLLLFKFYYLWIPLFPLLLFFALTVLLAVAAFRHLLSVKLNQVIDRRLGISRSSDE